MRLYYTLEGASDPFLKLGFANPSGPRNNVDLAFLTPEGKIIDVHRLKPLEGPSLEGAWVRDLVAREKNQAGDGREIVEKTVELMREIAKLYPAKREAPAAPWQVSLSHAVFVSAWDTQYARNGDGRDPRRMLIVAAPGGAVDPALAGMMDDADILRRFERHYVFAKVDPAAAPPEWAEALKQAGPRGLLIADTARTVDGFGKHAGPARIYPAAVVAKAGPFTQGALSEILAKHVAR